MNPTLQKYQPKLYNSKFLPPNSITPIIFTKRLQQGGQYRRNQPQWVGAFENLLTVVVQLYYKSDQKVAEFMKEVSIVKDKRPPGRKKKCDVVIDTQSGNNVFMQQDVLEILISPLRTDFPFELWTTKEMAIFECGLCRYGKQYEYLAQMVKTKTAQDIIQFYYFWKFTTHYRLWKQHKAHYHRNNLNNFV